MGRLLAPLAVLAAFTTLASAGIQITSPKAGDKLTAGNALKVEWKEGGSGPDVADLTTYQVFLCAGPNNPGDTSTINFVITPSGDFAKGGSSAEGKVDKGVGGNSPANAYYVKIVATAKKGGTLTVFSDRFSFTGMTGSFSSAFTTAMKDVTGTDGPKDVDATVGDTADASSPADEEFEVDYTMQTGATRYAPMQPVPQTKITAKAAKPQYPTSSVAIAKTKLPIPSIQTTITQSQTHKVSSIENTVAAAPMPSDDMAKFLNRWKD
ncbi:Cell wall synthesis protein kre9 precursor [Kalmusia sp. IMI 367209]|nr:Cell wall synthesis protein kre9 precursor [Kalmusia sp. IMI 367209]